MSIGLLYNRTAGRGRTNVKRLIEGSGLVAANVECVGTDSVEEAQTLLGRWRTEKRRVIIAGGDGTFHAATQVLADGTSPQLEIGLLPTGTGSDFLRSVAGGTDPASRLALALTGTARPMRPIAVDHGAGRCACLNVASVGLSGSLAPRIDAALNRFGRLGYTWAMIGGILGYQRLQMTLTADGATVSEGPSWVAVIGSGRFFGGGKMVTPKADPFGDKLHLVVIGDMGAGAALAVSAKLGNGKHVDDPRVTSILADRITLTGDPQLECELDGEVGPCGALTFSRGPVAFQLVSEAAE
jgi:diacylglycerol kinase (ATP)